MIKPLKLTTPFVTKAIGAGSQGFNEKGNVRFAKIIVKVLRYNRLEVRGKNVLQFW